MTFLTDWREPCAPHELGDLERTDFALEFLRRNPDYRRDHADMMRRIARKETDEQAAREEFAQRWGLRFPGGPARLVPRPTGAVAR